MHVAILGTYRPTQCGIATFTADVETSLRAAGVEVTVVPVVPAADAAAHLVRDGRLSVMRDDVASYVAAAQALSRSGVDIVLVQHEFGIFGGEAGAHVVEFVDALALPYAVTLHTVLQRFTSEQTEVVHRLCGAASVVTVFTESARRLLVEQELAVSSQVRVVPHGAPAELYAQVDRSAARCLLGLVGDGPVMSTFGLLSPGKGVETAIHAMHLLRSEHPDLHYVVAGRTHPEVARRDGERYRHSLEALADDLGVSDRVFFVDRFLDLDELAALLGLSDVVCTPYRGEEQSVSGVLTFALAAGCPIVSTPYRYARDVLADGAGIVVDFDDDEGIADAVHVLLTTDAGREARDAARRVSARMPWPIVGAALSSVLAEVIRPAPTLVLPAAQRDISHTADIGAGHLALLCDDTAMIQHAFLTVPRLEDGYCVDDAARALPVLHHLAAGGDRDAAASIGRLLAFLRSASIGAEPGEMRNLMSWERQWLDRPHVGDHVGRAVWGLGELAAEAGPFADTARSLLEPLARAVSPDWPTKTLAYSLLGLVAASSSGPSAAVPTWDEAIDRCLPTLRGWVPEEGTWVWFEPRLDYDHARVPEVLLRVGHHVGEPDLVDRGATMLAWLDALCLQGDHYRFPGHRGVADVKEMRWSGDEQPLEASALADAQHAWFRLSGDAAAARSVDRCWSWFLGNNRLGEPIVDLRTGAGRDGLGSHEVNRNCGAESTIAAHRCAMTWRAVCASLPEPASNGSLRAHA